VTLAADARQASTGLTARVLRLKERTLAPSDYTLADQAVAHMLTFWEDLLNAPYRGQQG